MTDRLTRADHAAALRALAVQAKRLGLHRTAASLDLDADEAARREAEAPTVPEHMRQAAARSVGLTSAPPMPVAPPPTAPDLVQRLRAMGYWKARPNQPDKWIPDALPTEAADAIEALRARVEVAEAERAAADNALVDKYRNPATGVFSFPSDVAAIIERLEAAEAQVVALRGALEKIARINLGPDKASGEWRCQEAEAIARNALAGGNRG